MSNQATALPFEIISTIASNAGLNEDFSYTYSQLLGGVFNTGNHSDALLNDEETIIETLNGIADKMSDDFTIEFDGNEYRIIYNDSIWDIYAEEIKQIVQDCYDLKLDNIPSFISVSVDWEATAHNAFADGFGHTFATYDGDETMTDDGKYWIFRTN